MKREVFVLFLFIASAAFGDERAEKRRLVSELLEVIDAKSMVRTSFENAILGLATFANEGMDVSDEARPEYEAERRREEAERRAFQDRMFARLDYTKYFDETYVPLFESEFTTAELRQLIEFFETPQGQKLARLLPRFGTTAGWGFIREAGEATQQELEQEAAAKHPWRKTMSDMRTIATAVEARATDVNEYTNVAFEELEALIAPVYIRHMPKTDAWGTPFLYIANGEHYRFVSAGADRRFEWSSRHLDLTQTEPRMSDSLDADIIFQDGNFLQSPKVAHERE